MTSMLLNRSLRALTIHHLISSSRAMSSGSSSYTTATLQRLFPDRASLSHASFHVDTDAPIVTPPGTSSPPAPVQSFLVELVRAAHAAAEASACGSALAGLSSESDEYADVALWIPADHPLAVDVSSSGASGVLNALGLSTWDANKSSLLPLDESTGLPQTLGSLNNAESTTLQELLSKLEERNAFSISQTPHTAYLLLGRYAGGWAGLAGIGVSSDE